LLKCAVERLFLEAIWTACYVGLSVVHPQIELG